MGSVIFLGIAKEMFFAQYQSLIACHFVVFRMSSNPLDHRVVRMGQLVSLWFLGVGNFQQNEGTDFSHKNPVCGIEHLRDLHRDFSYMSIAVPLGVLEVIERKPKYVHGALSRAAWTRKKKKGRLGAPVRENGQILSICMQIANFFFAEVSSMRSLCLVFFVPKSDMVWSDAKTIRDSPNVEKVLRAIVRVNEKYDCYEKNLFVARDGSGNPQLYQRFGNGMIEYRTFSQLFFSNRTDLFDFMVKKKFYNVLHSAETNGGIIESDAQYLLFEAVCSGDVSTVKWLLDSGVEPFPRIISHAIDFNQIPMASFLSDRYMNSELQWNLFPVLEKEARDWMSQRRIAASAD